MGICAFPTLSEWTLIFYDYTDLNDPSEVINKNILNHLCSFVITYLCGTVILSIKYIFDLKLLQYLQLIHFHQKIDAPFTMAARDRSSDKMHLAITNSYLFADYYSYVVLHIVGILLCDWVRGPYDVSNIFEKIQACCWRGSSTVD